MPSPRAGTVTPEITKTVKEYKAGKVEFRNDAGGNIHAVVGKVSFSAQQLQENIRDLVALRGIDSPACDQGCLCQRGHSHRHDESRHPHRRLKSAAALQPVTVEQSN